MRIKGRDGERRNGNIGRKDKKGKKGEMRNREERKKETIEKRGRKEK